MQVAELLAKNTVEQIKSGKQSRHPFQELLVLPEDYGKEVMVVMFTKKL